MAINVNNVYQTVLSVLNKEQRGNLPPFEFNQIATQVQLEIFEKYFEDLNQQVRTQQTDVDYADRVFSTEEKLEFATISKRLSQTPGGGVDVYDFNVPDDLYRLGSVVRYDTQVANLPSLPIITSSTGYLAEKLSRSEFNLSVNSNLNQPSVEFPVYTYQNNTISIRPGFVPFNPPGTVEPLELNYIRKPKDVRWGYTTGNLGEYIFDTTPYVADDLFPQAIVTQASPNLDATAPTLAEATYSETSNGIIITSPNGGSGLTFNMTITLGSGITLMNIVDPGSGYEVGDTITIDSSVFGGSVDALFTLREFNFMRGSAVGSTEFELMYNEKTEVILEILRYAGVVIKDPQIVQAASMMIQEDDVNEKR